MEPPPAARSARTCGRRVSQDSPHQQAGNSRTHRIHRGFRTGSRGKNRARPPRTAAPPLAARVVAQQASRKRPHPSLHHPSSNRDPHGGRDCSAFEVANGGALATATGCSSPSPTSTSRVLRLKVVKISDSSRAGFPLWGSSARPFISSRKNTH